MRGLFFKRVIPVVPQIFRLWNRIDCRLCSNERKEPGNNSEDFTADKILSDGYEPFPTTSQEISSENEDSKSPAISISSKHISFSERDAPVILDVEEARIAAQQAHLPKDPLEEVFSRISMIRGQEGVFDLHELVEVLKLCRARDLCVIAVPPEARYANYMLVVSGKSQRHMLAVAEFVRRVYKKKRDKNDHVPKIEGKNCQNWIALDLGNMILHIFSESAREKYDLESLWAVGSAYDPNCHKQEDSIVSLLQKHSLVLDNLHPAD